MKRQDPRVRPPATAASLHNKRFVQVDSDAALYTQGQLVRLIQLCDRHGISVRQAQNYFGTCSDAIETLESFAPWTR